MTHAAIKQDTVRVTPDGRMTKRDTATYLGRSVRTLDDWVLKGKGPRSVKVGGRRFWFKDRLDDFIRGSDTAA